MLSWRMRKTKNSRMPCGIVAATLLGLSLTASAAPKDNLRAGFLTPPDSAKPQTWWHWMNGNITKAGITADLEAMKAIGLGGATIVNVDCDIPPGPVPFMSTEWRDDFKFAVKEADRLGLKLSVENCAGWSSSGGPWNTPANAMQRLTSSETTAHGPTTFDAALPQPTTTLDYYRDIAVLAYKIPPSKFAPHKGTAEEKLVVKHAAYQSTNGGGGLDVTDKIIAMIKSGKTSVGANNEEMGSDPTPGEVKQLVLQFDLGDTPGTLTVGEGGTLIFPVNAERLAAARRVENTSINQTFVQPPPPGDAAGREAISHSDVIDVTSKLTADGKLHWDVPEGDWIILRLGYTPIGVENHPAPETGRGLECDKLSKDALDAHWDGFMQKVLDDIGPLAGKSLDTSLVDSYEVGNQDWTPKFREEFIARRGYDPLKYLPVFTGQIVDSTAVSERFLWDMRRTVADLFAENYYGHFAELCRRHGLLNASEPYSGPYESMQSGAPADVVMGEFWAGSNGSSTIKMVASIAHVYGKSIVGAESFTAAPEAGRWTNDPYSFKALGDLMYCQGLNRYIFHRYAMQPWTDRWPGMTMGQWGFHFERTETWWSQGKSWIDYISHCQYLLQQGRSIADVAYFTGQSAPVETRVGNPAMPAGYDYDAVNADVLLNGASVKNGRLTLASGASYAALVLPSGDINVTPRLLERLRELIEAGATVIGPRPAHSPSLEDYPACDNKVAEVAGEIWGQCDGVHVLENRVGKGRVVWGKPLADVLTAQKLKPDFEYAGRDTNTNLTYIHRIAGGDDIYFVSNQRQQFDTVECTFRVAGKSPELWHPDTGLIQPAALWNDKDGRTKLRLTFDPAGSVFVIFRPTKARANHVVEAKSTTGHAGVTSSKIEVGHAEYAAVDGSTSVDVTEKIATMAKSGHLDVMVNNDAMGGDPAPFHVKELRIDYTLNGEPGHTVVHENDKLTLPATPSVGQPETWEVFARADGQPAAKLWNNGRVDLRMADGRAVHAIAGDVPAPQPVTGQWNISFPPNWGAPPSVRLDHLISWTDHPDAGVRYFSGTATYTKELQISEERLKAGRELWLDLGTVKNFAEVTLNGHDLGVFWKPPFRVNLTRAAKPGVNVLTVKITNLWPNRLIGDEQLPPDHEWNGDAIKAWPQWLLDGKPSPTGRLTFTTWHHWKKDSTLLESGLLGPVTLQSAEVLTAK